MQSEVIEKPADGNQFNDSLKSDWSTLYIAGEWVNRENRWAIKDYDPYTGKTIDEVTSATVKDLALPFDTHYHPHTVEMEVKNKK